MLLINISGFIILKNNEKLERGSFIKINQSQYSTSKCKEKKKERKTNSIFRPRSSYLNLLIFLPYYLVNQFTDK